MARRIVAVACVALALGAAGCGGGDGGKSGASRPATATGPSTAPAPSPQDVARYRSEVAKATQTFARGAQRFRDAVGPNSGSRQVASALEAFQADVRSAADALSRLHPPPNVAAAHGQLVAAFRAIASACQPAIDAGRSGDRSRLRSALRTFQAQLNGPLGARAQEAATRIDAGLARE
jgi:thiamine pyrophosphate-dependent acetolactate synthase large subunit-like protein